jgi:hypothetical protein
MIQQTTLLLTLLAATIIVGCSSSRQTTAGSGMTGTAEKVLRQVEQSYQSTPLLSMSGEMKISGVPATLWFDSMVRQRDSMKIILTGPFGISVGAMGATRDHFIFYNSNEGVAVEGTPDRETFGKLMTIGLDYDEMVALLRAEIPHLPKSDDYTVRNQDGYFIYTTRNGGTTEEITIDGSIFAVKHYARFSGLSADDAGEAGRVPEFEIDYDYFKPLGSRQIARRAIVSIHGGEQVIHVSISKAEDTIDAGESLAIDIPAGITRRRM